MVHLVNGWQKSIYKETRAGLSKREVSLPGKGLEMSFEAGPRREEGKGALSKGMF